MDNTGIHDIQQQLSSLETELYKHESFIKTQQVAVVKLKMLFAQQFGYFRDVNERQVGESNNKNGQLQRSFNDDSHFQFTKKDDHSFPSSSQVNHSDTNLISTAVKYNSVTKTFDSAVSNFSGDKLNKLKRGRPQEVECTTDVVNRLSCTATKQRALAKTVKFCRIIPRFARQWTQKLQPTKDGRTEGQVNSGRAISSISDLSNPVNTTLLSTTLDSRTVAAACKLDPPHTRLVVGRKRDMPGRAIEVETIETTKRILSSGRFSDTNIVSHCKSIAANDGQRKWEILSDLDFCLTSSMRVRLQELLGKDMGLRDLLVSWLNQALVEVSKCSDSRMTNSIVEHTLKLFQHTKWTPADASLFQVDKLLKSLYKSYSVHDGAHQQSMATVLKGMWHKFRLMRKQYEKDGTVETGTS